MLGFGMYGHAMPCMDHGRRADESANAMQAAVKLASMA